MSVVFFEIKFKEFQSFKLAGGSFFVIIPIIFIRLTDVSNRFEFCTSYGAWIKVWMMSISA